MDNGVQVKEPVRRPRARREPSLDPENAAIVAARHGDPFAFLGMHEDADGLVVRALLPGAAAVAGVDAAGAVAGNGELVHPEGLFVARVAGRRARFRYRLRVSWGDVEQEFDDAYCFPPVLGDLDVHLLVEGTHLDSYRKLGAHVITHDGVAGVAFAVWAPNAQRVSVVGGFDAWDGRRLAMRKRHGGGFWEIFVPGIAAG